MSVPSDATAKPAMLSKSNRDSMKTLLDAPVLNDDEGNAVIVYVDNDAYTQIVSRRRFRLHALSYAIALRSLGVEPGQLVIIAHTQNLESIYLFWGSLLLGAIPSMFPTLTEKLDPDIYTKRLQLLITHSGAGAVVTTDEFARQLKPHLSCNVLSSSDLRTAEMTNVTVPNPTPSDIAFIQHSSGTTGIQKGVALSHEAVLNQVAAYSDAIQLSADDVIVSWLPLYHDMGLIAGFLLPMLQGIPLVLMSPFEWVAQPKMLLQAITDYGGTLCWLPNFAYNHMVRRIQDQDLSGFKLGKMRAFINCSEPVRHDSHKQFVSRFSKQGITWDMIAVSYAMAENTFAVTQTPLGHAPKTDPIDQDALQSNQEAKPATPDTNNIVTMVSCGTPITGTEVEIRDEAGAALAERKVGEVAIKSDCMLSSYYKRADLQPIQNGWYMSGDMGYTADGNLYIVGRKKDIIINAGKNIYPQDLEAVVYSVPGIKPGRAVVFGVEDEREGTELVAIVAEVETDDPSEQQRLKREIRLQIARQSTITASYVHLVKPGWLVKTSSGKIARNDNRDKWRKELAP